MIEDRDYYFLVHTSKDGHCHYTAIHTSSIDGQASSREWEAQGYDGEVPQADVKNLALHRMKDALIAKYVP